MSNNLKPLLYATLTSDSELMALLPGGIKPVAEFLAVDLMTVMDPKNWTT
jgi:hypothetical protein